MSARQAILHFGAAMEHGAMLDQQRLGGDVARQLTLGLKFDLLRCKKVALDFTAHDDGLGAYFGLDHSGGTHSNNIIGYKFSGDIAIDAGGALDIHRALDIGTLADNS